MPPSAPAPPPSSAVPAEADLQVRTRTGREIEIGPLRTTEYEMLFTLFAEIVESGDGFPQAPPLTRDVFEATWMRSTSAVITARTGGQTGEPELLGAYYLKPNFAPRAGHIANAGYAVAREGRGGGVGRALIEDSIARAPHLGFRAIQFNLVFASNPARRLYEELGWIEIGRIPDAVDGDEAVIYWRSVAAHDAT